MMETMIVLAGFVAYLSNSPGLDSIARPLIFVLLLIAALVAIMSKKVRPIAPTASELLLYAVGILSSAVALVRSTDYSIYYSMYFLTAIIFISVITRAVPLDRLLDLAARSILLCVLTTVLLQWNDLLMCLSISIGKNGLRRFGPFNNHPLLIGYIFGSGSLLMIRRACVAHRAWERYAMAAGAVLAWAMVLGASARSSVAGLVAAALFAYIREFGFFRQSSLGRAGMIAIVIAALVGGYFAATSPYLQKLLQVNSEERGIASGATGRTDLWEKGLVSFTSDPTLVAFGGGLRSSEYSVIGFLTENSYITILLDSGALLGSALILFFLIAPFAALRQSRASTEHPYTLMLLPSCFFFLLVNCVFVRYLVGLGNPTALYTLVLFVSLSMRSGFRQSLVAPSPRFESIPSNLRKFVQNDARQ
jgi:exopolysaccharide production protein ExoQ